MDHFSTFHLLGSLVQKTQAEVNLALPNMLNNGSESGALDMLLQQRPGSSDNVHKQLGNRVLEVNIVVMKDNYHGDDPTPCHMWLPLVQC
ncbi:hypothetical protein ACJMK2_018722 [Sinanodonta woodiana]|uniref:Uncharacterized protein n=1 Tax=Sinanodonta woodiana TaxID=1069815 RepID=A0ABD3UFW4_SINWO